MAAPEGNDYAIGNDGGRPTEYSPEYARQAKVACELGATDDELARLFDVSTRTIYRWKLEHEEFCQSIKVAKEFADDRVERALYQKAVGYEIEAVKVFMPAGHKDPVYAPYIERHGPDASAASFWLKNRRSQDWRDKQEVEHSVTDDVAELLDARRKRAQQSRV